MNDKLLVAIFFFVHSFATAQDNLNMMRNIPNRPALQTIGESVSLGIGVGFDYGGVGLNLLVYPQEHVGLFAGAGMALIGLGYNAGVKLRVPGGRVNPYAVAMYGYQTALKIENAPALDKFFYGCTVGAGVDLHTRKARPLGYWTMSLLIPLRTDEVDAYLKEYQIILKTPLSPVGFSAGYRFTF